MIILLAGCFFVGVEIGLGVRGVKTGIKLDVQTSSLLHFAAFALMKR
jgi:hypothetical protein